MTVVRGMKKTESLKTNYKNRFNRRLWLDDRYRDLLYYFENRNIVHGAFKGEPYWCVVPRTSIWKIPSMGTPGFDGWFGIAGDHPTDTVPLNYFDGSPQRILEHFVTKWLRASARLKQGEDYGDFNISNIEQRPVVGQLIEDRALRLQRWVDAHDLWQEVRVYDPVEDDDGEEDDENVSASPTTASPQAMPITSELKP